MSVQVEKLLEIVKDNGLDTEEMASFYKVSVGGRSLYITKTKKVSRVDLSGFDIKHPAVKRLSADEAHELKLGKVRGQIDFGKTEDRVLEAFSTALQMMKHLAETPVDSGATTPTLAKSANKKRRGKAISRKAKGRRGGQERAVETSSGAHA